MDPVIVMVGRSNEGVNDIEIMPDVPAGQLADAIAAALGWDGTYDIQINGSILDERQTLAEVEAWDGSELLMVVSNRQQRPKTPIDPTSGYRILRASAQTNLVSPVTDQQKTDGGNKALSTILDDNEVRNPDFRGMQVLPEAPTYTLLSSPKTKKTPTTSANPKDSDVQS
jgi:hypothetical protein